MGFFSWVCDKVSRAIDWVKDKFSRRKYDEDDVEDHVDVDAALAEFRESIQDDINKVEKKHMSSISKLFMDLKQKTKDKFPDLVEIIENEQERAEYELEGTTMKYIKQHLSKNDSRFLSVLKMNPGAAKKHALSESTDRVFEGAEKEFDSKLKKYAEHVLAEFTKRLNTRISNQESQMERRLKELERLESDARNGQIDVESLEDSCTPLMESAECIIHIFEMEM